MNTAHTNPVTAEQLEAVLIQLAQGKISADVITTATNNALGWVGCEGRHDGSLIKACVQIVTEACEASKLDHQDSAEFYEEEAENDAADLLCYTTEEAKRYSFEYYQAMEACEKAHYGFKKVLEDLQNDLIKSNI